MSKQEQDDNNEIIKSVYIPDEDLYGTIIQEGLYYSLIEYYDNGVGYRIEVDNDDYIVIDEFGIEYIDETEENL
jgi:hypothetical protein